MEHRYCVLRANLDELGYRYPLSIETVPLVEKLLSDLVKTTESLHEYKNIAQSAIEERDHLQLGAEPYKCDNAKLVQECNDLHLAFLRFREQTEKIHKDLKHRINLLEREKKELIDGEKKARDKLSKPGFKRTVPSKPLVGSRSAVSVMSTKSKSSGKSELKSKSTEELGNMMTVAEQRIANLAKEVKKLKADHMQQLETIDSLQFKLNNRDKEIKRLTLLLEGGRPLPALNRDCCYKDVNTRINSLSEENNILIKEKKNLEMQLTDAIAKQHEAMKRALHLAERNKQLEKELRDIDKMALAVEADCDSKVKNKSEKMYKIQEKLDSKDQKIEDLEREIIDFRRKKKEFESDLDSLTHEKQKLQEIVESALEDKKRMTDRINQFTRIEHDLNVEIDRLVQVSTLQKRKITELECQMVSGKFEQINSESDMDRRQKDRSYGYDMICDCCEGGRCKKKGRRTHTDSGYELDDKISVLKEEKEYYYNEMKKLRKQLEKASLEKPRSPQSDISRRLREKEREIESLQQELRELMRDKQNLLSKLEKVYDPTHNTNEEVSAKSTLSRVEKERDLARADVRRLEIERDALRDRLRLCAETNVIERNKLEQIINETEGKLHNIETERRELLTVQGSRRATINSLEEQVETLTNKLQTTTTELGHIQTLYSQLKTLQDQTDRALADTQGQLTQIEMEYAHAQDRVRELEAERANADTDLGTLRNDVSVLKSSLAKLDSEKDALVIDVDNKTETLMLLEDELKSKDSKIANLEMKNAELMQKVNLNNSNMMSQQSLMRSTSSELSVIKKELDSFKREKQNTLTENRRLQDDLSSVTNDNRKYQRELEITHREIDGLKRQLQEYVFEVKRAEDLLEKKENERTDMLDQFKSLSHEATMLENNNHSLETQAIETKQKLNEALDYITDLKHKCEVQDTLNKDLEKQIKQLTSQVASMETQVRQSSAMHQEKESELVCVRDLCCKLDGQKDVLLKNLKEKEESRARMEHDHDSLRSSVDRLESKLDRHKSELEKTEQLLASARQENIELRLQNSELVSEIERLKSVIEDLKAKHIAATQQLDVFQEKALEYSQQIKQLRREIANERFNRAHSAGDTSNRYPSL